MKKVSKKWKVPGFKRRVPYVQCPERKYRFWLSSFKKKLISFYKGLLDVTTNIFPKWSAYLPDAECRTFFRGNLKNPKSSNDALLTFIHVNNTHFGCLPLWESWSGFLICGVPFEQIHFQISDLSNPLWTRIHWITDLHDLKTDHWIIDPMRSFGRRIRN